MKLSDAIDEATVAELRKALDDGDFPGVSFQHAMEFVLTNGTFPASGLPVHSFLKLEAWARERAKARGDARG